MKRKEREKVEDEGERSKKGHEERRGGEQWWAAGAEGMLGDRDRYILSIHL